MNTRACVALAGVIGLGACAAHAESNTTEAPVGNPTAAVSASARLDFAVTLGSFVSLRVGSAGGTIDTVSFDLASLAPPNCTATPLPICFGNGNPVAATTSLTANDTLPVEVKSNGGQVQLNAQVLSPLMSGANTIPMSQIVLTSTDSDLPAPLLPNTGTGVGAGYVVSVAPTAFSNKVTNRSASWKFEYANTFVPAAGTYNGQVVFTATAL